MTTAQSDALVIFGASGDLAFKKIFPALQAMVLRKNFDRPIIGVARSSWSLAQFKARVKASLEAHDDFDPRAFTRLASMLHYISGDYNAPATYTALRQTLGDSVRPLYYLAIPPMMFSTVATSLATSGCTENARIVVEKPFGRDLASAQALNKTLLTYFPETAIFRIDHYLGKEPVQNLVYFRFANPLVEVGWNRDSIESIQITMTESFGVVGRGKFYEEVGAIRDVVQNHMLQVIACLAMECPCSDAEDAMRDERVRLLKSIRSLDDKSVIRGQYQGYRHEPGVAVDSRVETYAALRFHIDNPRWDGVPFYVRVGKCLPITATEILVRFKCPHRSVLSECSPRLANYYRLRISPEVVIAIGARVKKPGDRLEGESIELLANQKDEDEMSPYERLLSDAAKGDSSLFARQDAVEESWRIVDQVIGDKTPLFEYDVGTWGPFELTDTVKPEDGWNDPAPNAREAPHMLQDHLEATA